MKENIRNTKTGDELSENSGDIRENRKMHRLKKKFFSFVCIKWLLLLFKDTQMQEFTQ